MKFNQNLKNYTKSLPKVKTLIHWYDLYEGHYVFLEKEFQKTLFQNAIKKAGSFSKLGRKLDISRKTISSCSQNKINTSINTLKKIAKYTGYPLKEINNKIIAIGKSKSLKAKLPFKLNNIKGAEIRAAFLSDGHVDKGPTKPTQYCAFEKELHTSLIKICRDIFGYFKAETKQGNKTLVTRFPAAIGQALELGGVPRGNKTKQNPHLPKDILLGNKSMQAAYLRRVFDDEGYVHCNIKNKKRLIKLARCSDISHTNIKTNISEIWIRNITQPKNIQNNLLKGELLLLSLLGIEAKPYFGGIYKSKKGNITAKDTIRIAQQDQLKKFANIINFSIQKKKDKLSKAIESYQYKKLRMGEGKAHALDIIHKYYNKKGYIEFKDLAKEIVKTGRSYDLAGQYLKRLCKNGTIKKVKYGVYKIKNDKT